MWDQCALQNNTEQPLSEATQTKVLQRYPTNVFKMNFNDALNINCKFSAHLIQINKAYLTCIKHFNDALK